MFYKIVSLILKQKKNILAAGSFTPDHSRVFV